MGAVAAAEWAAAAGAAAAAAGAVVESAVAGSVEGSMAEGSVASLLRCRPCGVGSKPRAASRALQRSRCMVYAWCMHGVCMVYAWCMHGVCMPGERDGGCREVEVDHHGAVEAARGVARVQRRDLRCELHLAMG